MEPFVGTIMPWSVGFAPRGWVFCDGSLLPIRQNQALFALLGIRYGGDGVNTFAVPDLRSKIPLGGQNVTDLGRKGGAVNAAAETKVTLVEAQLPAHTHPAVIALTASTALSVGTATTGGGLLPATGATLTSTTAGQSPAAALYLPSSVTPVSPVNLGGVKTDVVKNATGTATVAKNLTQNAPVNFTTVAANTLPPVQTINYIIATEGVYPTRN